MRDMVSAEILPLSWGNADDANDWGEDFPHAASSLLETIKI